MVITMGDCSDIQDAIIHGSVIVAVTMIAGEVKLVFSASGVFGLWYGFENDVLSIIALSVLMIIFLIYHLVRIPSRWLNDDS